MFVELVLLMMPFLLEVMTPQLEVGKAAAMMITVTKSIEQVVNNKLPAPVYLVYWYGKIPSIIFNIIPNRRNESTRIDQNGDETGGAQEIWHLLGQTNIRIRTLSTHDASKFTFKL
jgi:hypothetical protein